MKSGKRVVEKAALESKAMSTEDRGTDHRELCSVLDSHTGVSCVALSLLVIPSPVLPLCIGIHAGFQQRDNLL